MVYFVKRKPKAPSKVTYNNLDNPKEMAVPLINFIQKVTFRILLLAMALSGCSKTISPTTPAATPEPSPTPAPPETPTDTPSPEEALAWNEDLDFFMTRLREIHPNPFYRVSEEEYLQSINDLKAKLPNLTDDQIIVELARIVAFIDGHSAMNTLGEPVNFHHYPFRLYLFSDGLYVIGAQAPFEDTVGGEILQIGGTPIANVIDAITPLVPHDNPMTVQLGLPSWVMRPEILIGLGIIDSLEAPQIMVELTDGSQQTINPSPLTWDDYREWSRSPAIGNGFVSGLPQRLEPLYLSRAFSDDYWFTYLEDSETLYIQYNRIQRGIDSMVNQIREFLDQQDVERVVLDTSLQ
jgi:hypothetical protein